MARTQRYRARRRQGTRCIIIDVSEGDVAALVARSYLSEEASRNPSAIKAAIEGLMSDVVFELETERSTRSTRNASRPHAVTRDGLGGHRLSEIRTSLPEVKPDRRLILMLARHLYPQAPIFGLAGAFEGETRVRRVWPGKGERLKARFGVGQREAIFAC
jgi:hypothetical protein